MRFPTFDARLHRRIVAEPDYVRYAAMALAVRRLAAEGVAGSFADVGVYRGRTAALLHALDPERTLYLFDTFEGFPREQLEPDRPRDERFRDTSIAEVRRRVGASDRVVIRAGRIPDTLAGLEDERFAFVSLDLDLHEPTRRSLEFFYPRLSAGAYVFVHDYNSPESNRACQRALDACLRGKPERPVELPDVWGTALFRKA